MILQALVDYYEVLAKRGEIVRLGWGRAGVTHALRLSPQGEVLSVLPVKQQVQRGKKTVEIPQMMELPKPVEHGTGIEASFMYDTTTYLIGADAKGKPERAQASFDASRELHLRLLEGVDSPTAHAVCAYFETWQPAQAAEHPALQACWDELMKGAKLIFSTEDSLFAHQDQAISHAWDQAQRQENPDAIKARCLVTGKMDEIALVHGKIKGVPDSHLAGASLVSFNSPSFESYGRETAQGLNAPVGEYANFAYTTALNHLLADEKHRFFLGDTVVVYWSKSGNPIAQDWFSQSFGGTQDENQQLHEVMQRLGQGKYVDPDGVNLQEPFYILGIAPNVARLSVRFFLQDSFGNFLKLQQKHFSRLEIAKSPFERQYLSMYALLRETVNLKSRDKSSSPLMTGAVLRAILTGERYPESLYQGVITRIRAEQDEPDKQIKKISRGRAAIIKAYLLHNVHMSEEEITVALNEQSNERAYVLGRMFAVLEKAQQDANPGINTTIKDRYFTSACATPGSVFPVLLRLAQHHISKAKYGYDSDNRLKELMDKLDIENDPIPAHLSLKDQGIFILGYYHQAQARYVGNKNKEEN